VAKDSTAERLAAENFSVCGFFLPPSVIPTLFNNLLRKWTRAGALLGLICGIAAIGFRNHLARVAPPLNPVGDDSARGR
jgi:hypothetical protein